MSPTWPPYCPSQTLPSRSLAILPTSQLLVYGTRTGNYLLYDLDRVPSIGCPLFNYSREISGTWRVLQNVTNCRHPVLPQLIMLGQPTASTSLSP